MKAPCTMLTVFMLTAACAGAPGAPDGVDVTRSPGLNPTTRVVLAADADWRPLNPARGDKSPAAGVLWGDIQAPGPTGFLLRPVDGFESPPHIHNVSYRGVVIRGVIHNDDPDAAKMWMPAGSYWTQPKGEVHITAAKGTETLAYIEIEDGPYLVKPPAQAFDPGEAPVNVDASNVVWVDAPKLAGDETTSIAYLWGEPSRGTSSGALIKIASGASATVIGAGESLRVIVAQGTPRHREAAGADATLLAPGSFIGADGPSAHALVCEGEVDCVFYVRAIGALDLVSGR